MTLLTIPTDQLPSTTSFLSSPCPGVNHLDDNIHFAFPHDIQHDQPSTPTTPTSCVSQFSWPLSSTPKAYAQLNSSYLNIARPPLVNKNESTTYVNLPYHITNLFKKVVEQNDKSKDGEIHIGSNLNPLSHDPFKYTNLNPGCISKIIELERRDQTDNDANGTKNKLSSSFTSSFNRLLNLKGNSIKNGQEVLYKNLLTEKPLLIDRLLSFDEEKYYTELKSPTTHKLLVSAHVNVLNIFALDEDSNYKHTKSYITDKPIIQFPQSVEESQDHHQLLQLQLQPPPPPLPHRPHPLAQSIMQPPSTNTVVERYTKVIEEPILRLQFRQKSIVTSVTTFVNNQQPMLLVGLDTGEIFLVKLGDLGYQVFDDLGVNDNDISLVCVTTMEIIHHPNYEYLIVAGFSNGEVTIIDPNATPPGSASTNSSQDDKVSKKPTSSLSRYEKKVVGSDTFVTYFKKFDLSPFTSTATRDDSNDNQYPVYLVGHFKLSRKPIMAITSTLTNTNTISSSSHGEILPPLILAIASDDGLVRIFDLLFTYKCNYGSGDPNCNTIVTDLISNYFHDGIYDVEFSPDFKFLCLVGKGDLIEIFKMSYYNMNGLLAKNTIHSTSNIEVAGGAGSLLQPQQTATAASTGRRSRSGTINSVNSNNAFSIGKLLAPYSTGTSTPDNKQPGNLLPKKDQYPPMIKDIQIIGRFKGHTNTVKKIQFVKSSSLIHDNSPAVYNLISCGNDGRMIIWEFDYKALPKVKKPKLAAPLHRRDSTRRRSLYDRKKNNIMVHSPSPVATRRGETVAPMMQPQANAGRHLSPDDPHSLNMTANNMNMVSMLTVNDNPDILVTKSPTTGVAGAGAGTPTTTTMNDQIEIVFSLYRSLFDIRARKHYKRLARRSGSVGVKKVKTIVSPIVNDKLVPLIDVPLCVVEFSEFIQNGKLDGFYFDDKTVWVFAKNGDLFRYSIC